MPAPRRKALSRDAETAIELSELFTCIAEAVLDAKAGLDQEAVALADEYKTSPLLSLLSPPSFAIGEVRFVIKYAVAQIEPAAPAQRSQGPPNLYVHVDAASLGEIAPHLISEIEVRIVPELKGPLATEEEIDSMLQAAESA
jgi:hypothetical protein